MTRVEVLKAMHELRLDLAQLKGETEEQRHLLNRSRGRVDALIDHFVANEVNDRKGFVIGTSMSYELASSSVISAREDIAHHVRELLVRWRTSKESKGEPVFVITADPISYLCKMYITDSPELILTELANQL